MNQHHRAGDPWLMPEKSTVWGVGLTFTLDGIAGNATAVGDAGIRALDASFPIGTDGYFREDGAIEWQSIWDRGVVLWRQWCPPVYRRDAGKRVDASQHFLASGSGDCRSLCVWQLACFIRYVRKVANPPGAKPFVPETASLEQLQRAAQGCQGCELYRAATQAVLGEGPVAARIMLVGEQPGDREDLAGRPFVGPAGSLLDRALTDAGIERADVYITNAVKHFKFEERGKRRIHKKPSSVEIVACKPWLEAELAIVQPRLIVCLGATAAQSVIGPHHRLLEQRGRFFPHPSAEVTATVHPSAILRSPDPAQRQLDYQAFVKDLAAARERLKRKGKSA